MKTMATQVKLFSLSFSPFIFKIKISYNDKFFFWSIAIEVCDERSWQNVWVNIDTGAIWW